jgi:hypothetical protein
MLASFFLAGALAATACRRPSEKASAEAHVAPDAAVPVSSAAPSASVSASSSAATRAPAPGDPPRIELSDPDLRAWIDARMAAAKAGKRERVRIPLVHHGDGWGCVCPPYYVGESTVTAQGPWIEPTFSRGARALRPGERAYAEGVFGATTTHVRYPDGPPPTGFWEYDLVPFTVSKLAPLPEGEDGDAVVLERL